MHTPQLLNEFFLLSMDSPPNGRHLRRRYYVSGFIHSLLFLSPIHWFCFFSELETWKQTQLPCFWRIKCQWSITYVKFFTNVSRRFEHCWFEMWIVEAGRFVGNSVDMCGTVCLHRKPKWSRFLLTWPTFYATPFCLRHTTMPHLDPLQRQLRTAYHQRGCRLADERCRRDHHRAVARGLDSGAIAVAVDTALTSDRDRVSPLRRSCKRGLLFYIRIVTRSWLWPNWEHRCLHWCY